MNILALRRSLLPLSGFCMPSDGGSSGGGDGGSSGSNGGNGSGSSGGDSGGGNSSDGGYGDSTGGMQSGYGDGMGYGGPTGFGGVGTDQSVSGFSDPSTATGPSYGDATANPADARDALGTMTWGDERGTVTTSPNEVSWSGGSSNFGNAAAGAKAGLAAAGPVGGLIGGLMGYFSGKDVPGSVSYGNTPGRTAGNEGAPQGDGGGGSSGLGAAGTNPLDPNGPKTTTGLPAAAATPKYVWDGHKYVETATGAQNVMRPDAQGMFKQASYESLNPNAPRQEHMMDTGLYRGDQSASGAQQGVFAKGGPVGIAAGAPEQSRMVRGEGNGQSDSIPVKMDGGGQGRLSDGEFVISADVVSALGNGSSEAGAKMLHELMSRVRSQAHGSPKQSRPVNPAQVLPA